MCRYTIVTHTCRTHGCLRGDSIEWRLDQLCSEFRDDLFRERDPTFCPKLLYEGPALSQAWPKYCTLCKRERKNDRSRRRYRDQVEECQRPELVQTADSDAVSSPVSGNQVREVKLDTRKSQVDDFPTKVRTVLSGESGSTAIGISYGENSFVRQGKLSERAVHPPVPKQPASIDSMSPLHDSYKVYSSDNYNIHTGGGSRSEYSSQFIPSAHSGYTNSNEQAGESRAGGTEYKSITGSSNVVPQPKSSYESELVHTSHLQTSNFHFNSTADLHNYDTTPDVAAVFVNAASTSLQMHGHYGQTSYTEPQHNGSHLQKQYPIATHQAHAFSPIYSSQDIWPSQLVGARSQSLIIADHASYAPVDSISRMAIHHKGQVVQIYNLQGVKATCILLTLTKGS